MLEPPPDRCVTQDHRVVGPTHDLADLDIAVEPVAVLAEELEPPAARFEAQVGLLEVMHLAAMMPTAAATEWLKPVGFGDVQSVRQP